MPKSLESYLDEDLDIGSDGREFAHAIVNQGVHVTNLENIAKKVYDERGFYFGSEYDYVLSAIRNWLLG